MAGKKVRGVITVHQARYHQDREIKPCRYIGPKKTKVLVAQFNRSGSSGAQSGQGGRSGLRSGKLTE